MRVVCVIASALLVACSADVGPAGDGAAPADLAGAGDSAAGGDALGPSPLSLLPDTTDGIHLFADQLPSGLSDALVRFAAAHFAGTQKMLHAENDRYRAVNPSWLLLHYRLGASSGPVDYIHNNAWSSDWAQVTTHEDWFMHNELNQRHHDSGSNWDINDPESAGFRQYWITSVIDDMRATGAQGVFADSFEAGISGYGVTPPDARFSGTNPANPSSWPNGVTWLAQKKSFIDFVEAAFAATPERFVFVPNIGAMITGWADTDYSTIDGAMLESFAWQLAPADWVLGMNRAMALTRAGKFIIVQSYPDASGAGYIENRDFLIGTYLLMKGSRTFVNLAGSGVTWFPEYALDLGAPVAALPSDVSAYAASGAYRRDFVKGAVVVNPNDVAATVALGGTFQRAVATGGGAVSDADLDGSGNYISGSLTFTPVTSVTLQPHTAALLVR
jgi:Hypothetical glycosyl hydrolase family 15